MLPDPQKQCDVLCLGILVADVICSPIESLPASGELCLTDDLILRVGGCAANTAVDLARLGRQVRVVGKVGEDFFGHFILHDLARQGVEVSSVRRSSTHRTSATSILNVRGEDRRFIHFIGANADFTAADVEVAALDSARALYVGGFMIMQRFTSGDLACLMREAHQRGVITMLDVVIPAGKEVGMSCVEQSLPYVDVFLPNTDEAALITGEHDPARQADALARAAPDCTIVITQGRAGLLVRSKGLVLRAGAYNITSVDESGAGDAFDAGFLTGLLEGWPLEKTIRFASAVGASSTRALGCTDGVFRFQEALDFIAKWPLEIERIA